MLKVLKILLLVVLIPVAVVVLILGYLGFVPGLSHLMGSDKPRDLGVVATAEDLKSAYGKSKETILELPASTPDSESVKFEGATTLNVSFTQQELTAFFNDCRWKYCMMTDSQMRTNPDGSVEVSGMLHLDRMEGYGRRFKLPMEQIKTAMDALKLAPASIPFYAKSDKPTGANGHVDLNLSSVEFGRLPVPSGLIADHDADVNGFVDGQISQVNGFSMKSADFNGGTLNFVGDYPATTSVVPR